MGHGDAFALRDPNAIRPAFYYKDDEVLVVASERPVIQTAFNVKSDKVKEIKRGHALIIKKDGKISEKKSESLLTEHPARLKEFILAEETTRIFIKKDLSLEKNFPQSS